MRIAFVLHKFPVISETFILRQITGLMDAGHEVDIYAEWRPGEGPVHPEFRQYGLSERTVYLEDHIPPESGRWAMPARPFWGKTWLPDAERPISNSLRHLRALPCFLQCLVRSPRLSLATIDARQYGEQATSLASLYYLHRFYTRFSSRYDLIHIHFGPVGRSFRYLREVWAAPLVVSFHGYDFTTYPRTHGRRVYDGLFAQADRIVANSGFTRMRLEDLGCPADKIVEIPVGLNTDEFPFLERHRKPDEPVRLLTVARLVEIKGVEYALRAVAEVSRRMIADGHSLPDARKSGSPPQIHYDIVGDGPLRKSLHLLAKDLGIERIVTFHGARDTKDVRQIMKDAHLFLLTSVSVEGDQEGQGLVLQEAQATGLPVIATRHGAFPEGLRDGQTGYLVPERDVAALADRIAMLIRHPERWPEIGRCGHAFVKQKYDIRRLNRDLLAVYQETIHCYKATSSGRAQSC
jgi:colanic acid/amylovoran biosynthesis glycosyltransferase